MILYFNPAYLKHPTIQQSITENRGSNTLSNLLNLNKINSAHSAIYSRKGINLLPFKNKLIDGIIEEPLGGAHNDVETAIANVKKAIQTNYKRLKPLSSDKLIDERIAKFSDMGVVKELEA